MYITYDDMFYEMQWADSLKSARIIVPLVVSLLKPRSVIDFGCGVGTWLLAFAELGVSDYIGIDGDYVPRDRLQIAVDRFRTEDLTAPIALAQKRDLACALEVAEHLPEGAAETFISSLTNASRFVLFSAAIPAQGGAHHINEQWQDYWREKFDARGYIAMDVVRPKVWGNADVRYWYQQNTILYGQKEEVSRRPELAGNIGTALSLNLVHPEIYLRKCHRIPSMREIVRALPQALINATRERIKFI